MIDFLFYKTAKSGSHDLKSDHEFEILFCYFYDNYSYLADFRVRDRISPPNMLELRSEIGIFEFGKVKFSHVYASAPWYPLNRIWCQLNFGPKTAIWKEKTDFTAKKICGTGSASDERYFGM